MPKDINCKDCTINAAIGAVALEVEQMFLAGAPYDGQQIVEMIEGFCEEAPSERWHAISKGVIEKLVYWEVIEPNGTISRDSKS